MSDDMTALQFIDWLAPYHNYLDLTQGAEFDIAHPPVKSGERLNTWAVITEFGDSVMHRQRCQRCRFLEHLSLVDYSGALIG